MTKKTVIVIGAGAGGATIARALAGRFHVKILDRRGDTPAFRQSISTLARLRSTGLFFDARMIAWLVRRMAIHKMDDGMLLVSGHGPGGTTPLAAGNGVRADEGLLALGLRLDDEFAKLAIDLPISPCREKRWTPKTRKLYTIFQDLGLGPNPTPKLVDFTKCTRCGKCVMGCQTGARWDARRFLAEAIRCGAELKSHSKVVRIHIQGSRAVGVHIKQRGRYHVLSADHVVLAAGGLGTPQILENSGITTDPTLFVDPVLCVAAEVPGANQDTEIPMPFVARQGPTLLSPYFDWLSFFFDRRWRFPSRNILSLMIKLADTPIGHVTAKGTVHKTLSSTDHAQLDHAVQTCHSIFERLGIPPEKTFLGTLHAGHPGGTLALTPNSCSTMHDARLPQNCWVADSSLLPGPFGMPPILTVMALAERIAKHICNA
jgi:choline dehydrogenase-like flavoprotein